MNLCLYGRNNGIPSEVVAPDIGLTSEQVQRNYDDIDSKRAATRHLHLPAQLIEVIPEIR